MKKGRTYTVNKAASLVLSFILFILFFVMTLFIGIYSGLFHKSVLINNLYISDYGTDVEVYLYSAAEDITLSSGVPKENINDIFSTTIVKHDINKYAEAAINGEEYEIETIEIENKIRENINNYVTTEGITLDEEQNKFLDEYIATICEEYVDSVKVPFIDKFCTFKNMFMKYFAIVIIIIIVLCVFDIFTLFNLNRWKHRIVRYISYSVLATAFSTIVLPAIVIAGGEYKKIGLSPKYFYNLIVSSITELLKSYIYIGVLWAIIATLLIIVINRLKNCSFDVIKREKKVNATA